MPKSLRSFGTATFVLLLAAPHPSYADVAPSIQSVITANPHRITACNQTTPPQNALASSAALDANAYHTIGCVSANPNPTCIVNTVLGSGFVSHGKPRIIASDGGKWTNAHAIGWIGSIQALNQSLGRPVAHYEHYERHFGEGCELTGCGVTGSPCIQGCPDGLPCNRSCPMTKITKDFIDTEADFPDCAGSDALRAALGNAATRLPSNGQLYRSGDTFRWRAGSAGSIPATLMGYGWMGSLAGLQFNVDGYLNALSSFGNNGVNLTRVWAVEQWTALAVGRSGNQSVAVNGVTPFRVASLDPPKYGLFGANPAFYARLRGFAQGAADRGIVLQLSLFDKHGLGPDDEGRWDDSPYRARNNANGFLPDEPPLSACFLSWSGNIGTVHQRYLQNVAEEVGGVGNVVFEIFNEAMDADFDVSECPLPSGGVVQWQVEAAQRLRRLLPTSVARDAFNEDADLLPLAGKGDDATGRPWEDVGNARISSQFVGAAGRRLGKVVSADDGTTLMKGALPLDLAGQRVAAVRANLNRTQGRLGLGLGNATDRLYVDFGLLDTQTLGLQLRRRVGGVEDPPLAVYTLPSGTASVSVRLRVDIVSATASVYVDSALPVELTNVPLGVVPSYGRAFFQGWIYGGGPYLSTHGSVDDFEAATYCNDAAACSN
jgi:hypothetical protein